MFFFLSCAHHIVTLLVCGQLASKMVQVRFASHDVLITEEIMRDMCAMLQKPTELKQKTQIARELMALFIRTKAQTSSLKGPQRKPTNGAQTRVAKKNLFREHTIGGKVLATQDVENPDPQITCARVAFFRKCSGTHD